MSAQFQRMLLPPTTPFQCIIDYNKFLKFLYDVATIGQKKLIRKLFGYSRSTYVFPVSKRIKKGGKMKRIFKLVRYFQKLLREMCNLGFHHGVTTIRQSPDAFFDTQKFNLKNTQTKETMALLTFFSCLLLQTRWQF